MPGTRTSYRTCPLCEATCGLEITTSNGDVTGIRGDAEDVFSHGFLCPKGVALKALHEDPDRLRTPVRRTAGGDFTPVGWDETFAEIDERLTPILEAGGRDAVGVYIGNPAAHHLAPVLYGRVFLKALGSRNIFSASTVDQYPKQFSAGLMFGTGFSVPVPDVDRTDHLMILGANPLASNGSLLTAPDMRGRLRAIRSRGGKVVVIDPRRSRTAEEADEHHFIRPGTDAHLLAGIAQVLVDEGLADPGAVAEHCAGLDEEIETPGEGQIRAMTTVAGNPTVSTPNAGRLARALESLEFMVSLDIYVNETTRHANLILPAPSPLQRSHFDLALYNFSAHNVANYSPPVFELDEGALDEWETLLRLTGIVSGQGPDGDVEALDRLVVETLVQRELATPGSRLAGREADELLAELSARRGPERLPDLLLRARPSA